MESSGTKSHLNSRRGVRIVGKIRRFLDSEANGDSSCSSSLSQISMSRTDGDHALISFGDQTVSPKDCYKLDWCYGQDEGVSEVFCKEVKPLLEGLQSGCNGCVVAYGAQGSGKTQLIQGSEENPGLALMAISHILPVVEEIGGEVAVSCYEVYQDHVYDLLEPKEQEVLVMEDANRKIQFKGLSKVPIRTTSDFERLFLHGSTQRKPSQKVSNDVEVRSHRGLIMYVSCVNKESNHSFVGKMNFVDLAGYEDAKRKSTAKPNSGDNAKINKSLYALLNVVQALNNNEAYVPYRETRLTRFLQDFICRTSSSVIVTCLNSTPCQDTIHAVSLASRSCQVVSQQRRATAKNSKHGSNLGSICSPLNGRIQALDASVKKLEISQSWSIGKKGFGSLSATKRRPQPSGNSLKTPGTSLRGSFVKKANDASSMTQGRNMLTFSSPATNSDKGTSLSVSSSTDKMELSGSEVCEKTSVQESCISSVVNNLESSIAEEDAFTENENNHLNGSEVGPCNFEADVSAINEDNHLKHSDIGLVNDSNTCTDPHDGTTEPENQNVGVVSESSPLLSEKLREISNSLKFLSSKPISVNTPQHALCKRQVIMEPVELKTPGVPFYLRLDDKSRFEDIGTPQDILQTRSTGLKKSLVQECLTFLNSANKEELKELKGIGEKRATYILECREETPEPFKQIDDLKDLGLSSKQIKGMMAKILGDF